MHRSDLYDRINLRMACKEQYKDYFRDLLRPNLHKILCVYISRAVFAKRGKEEKRKKANIS